MRPVLEKNFIVCFIRVLQKNRTSRTYSDIYREIYYRNLFRQLQRPRSPKSAICKLENRKVSGVIQTESEGLRIGAHGLSPGLSLNTQESPRAGEDRCFSSSTERRCPSPTLPLLLFRPSTNWMMMATSISEGNLLHTTYQFKCLCLLETPSQTHPEIMLYQLSGHPSAQIDT